MTCHVETRSQAASKLKVPELVALKSLVAAGRGWRSVYLGVKNSRYSHG